MNVLLISALMALPPLMPLNDVQPGQRGECLTVFEGDAVEPFEFVIKGVLHDFLGPRRPLVLARLVGEKPEFTGVVAGMSGSPCFIGGKLLGALGYSFGIFTKEPIAGITPIDGMLAVMQLPAQKRPWRISAAGDTTDWDAFRAGTAPARTSRPDGMRPIAAPLSMGGVVPRVREHFDPWLREAGFEPMAGGSHAGDGKPKALVPGAAISAVLVSGDVDIAATGTVTSVEGDQVLAFGHPFSGVGAISIPMASASIVNTLVSARRSRKMASIGPIIGEITQDRLTAIGGRIGSYARMVPVRGSLVTPQGREAFEIQVARDVGLTPRFVAVGLASALARRVDAGDRGTVRLRGTLEAEGLEPVKIENVYSAERDGRLFIYSGVDMARAFRELWDTPFGPPPKMRIEVEAQFEPDPVQERVEAIHVDRARVRPGEPIEVAVRLRRSQGGSSLERFTVQVPRSWANAEVQLVAAGVHGAETLERNVAGRPHPTELRQISKWLSLRRANGNLYLMAVRHGTGMRSGVDMHSFLPPSAVVTMSGDPSKQKRKRGLAWEERRPRPGTVDGQASTSFKVLSR